jgi:hypothetical protein
MTPWVRRWFRDTMPPMAALYDAEEELQELHDILEKKDDDSKALADIQEDLRDAQIEIERLKSPEVCAAIYLDSVVGRTVTKATGEMREALVIVETARIFPEGSDTLRKIREALRGTVAT